VLFGCCGLRRAANFKLAWKARNGQNILISKRVFSLEFVVYRFVLRENIVLFQNVLKVETAENVRNTIQGMLLSVKRELAMLESRELGVQDGPWPLTVPHKCLENGAAGDTFRVEFGTSSIPYLALDPRPGLRIIDINDAYARATMTRRAALIGRPIFEVFPDNPDDPHADGVSNLYASLCAAADSRRPNAMPIQRYDIRDAGGRFVERYWRQLNTPVFNSAGRLNYLLHHTEDVTESRIT
jgi:PAS domain-containing protein